MYFGYTNCPDVCPTTMADLGAALDRLDDEDAARVDVAMVTVDPERDTAVLADYVQSFVADAHAMATDDPAALRAAGGPVRRGLRGRHRVPTARSRSVTPTSCSPSTTPARSSSTGRSDIGSTISPPTSASCSTAES